MRKHNSTCICYKSTYRRPYEILKQPIYVCKLCRVKKQKICITCKNTFTAKRSKNKYCSTKCSNVARRGITYSKNSYGNKTKQRYNLIVNTYKITSCMVEGCTYNITLDIHRHIPGRLGGKYELGNMFLICPNCHAEETRGFCLFEKINDFTLRKV